MIRMGATSSTSWAPPGLPGSGALLGVAAGRELVAGPSFGLAGLGAASRGARWLVGGWWEWDAAFFNGDLMENHRKTHGKWWFNGGLMVI